MNFKNPVFGVVALALSACGGEAYVEDGAVEEAVASTRQAAFSGVNGTVCEESPYNCKLRPSGGNRVLTNDPDDDDSWELYTGGPIRDGNGTVVGTSTRTSSTFNHGQTRTFAGELHAFAVSTSNSSAGWMPMSAIKGRTSFEDKVGHVSALGSGLSKMACYAVRNSHDTTLEFKKVVYDSDATHERAGDYLPLVRANGLRSANLTFNVPGFGLGGVAVDHFPAGTKFQRLDVPTNSGAPSIDIPLWVQDSVGRYRQQSGTMKFIYGYVIAATGTPRNGWMAYDALQVSSGCP
ncbi:hypothetical protein [Corallococcus llansteffanensis]|uniref:Uncharacterized protein n=1 Tax=Corallococcus llansteffanensis TaxID=2316731 RepID=A0A3A8NXD1_9BACT|nr:hypothetical protein [Corallococcus llansteffanensis]RKH46871.1 hypothetical protein D7V93_34420 [Corallococcus llansteffanensis]